MKLQLILKYCFKNEMKKQSSKIEIKCNFNKTKTYYGK